MMERVKLTPVKGGYKVTGGGERATFYETYREANNEAMFRMNKINKFTSGR